MSIPLTEKTVAQYLRENALRFGKKPAYLFEGTAYSWKDAEKITGQIAAMLLHKGLAKGDRVALWSVNTPCMVFYMLGAMKVGVIPVPLNYSFRSFELQKVLEKSAATGIFLGAPKKNADYRGMVSEIRPQCPALQWVEEMRLPDENAAPLPQEAALAGPHDPACIAFTSGSTSTPKAVVLTQYNLLNNALQFGQRMRNGSGDVLAAALPLFHSSGITGMMIQGLVWGMTAIIHRTFCSHQMLEDMERYYVTVLMAVPSMLELLILDPSLAQRDISSLRVIQTSESNISPAKMENILKRLGSPKLITGYGQTECSPLITTVSYEDDLRTAVETAGKPLDHVQIRIWKPDGSGPAGVGEIGEIQVQGFNTMPGYYQSPEENAKKFTRDGWLKTTDAGFLDERGNLHFARRISQTIIRHGENISPAEVEEVVESFSPDILEARVVGVPAPVVQEEAACLLRARVPIDPDALRAFVKTKLASFKVPKFVFQVSEFPTTDTGKVDLAAVRELAKTLAGQAHTDTQVRNDKGNIRKGRKIV